jgi:hypothetical protein
MMARGRRLEKSCRIRGDRSQLKKLQGGEDNNPNAADEPGYWMGVQEIAIAADWER